MFDEETNGTPCTADLWRAAQRSRGAYLGFWLGSVFRKPLTYGLKKSQEDASLGVVLAFPPHKPEVTANIAELPSPQARMATGG
jgi:hypothetical protein